MRDFTVAHEQVQVLCNASGTPGSCRARGALPYDGWAAYSSVRESHQSLMLTHLVPRHLGAWFLLFDLDEFLTAPNHPTRRGEK